MKNFKKSDNDREDFLRKNNLHYKEGTIERQRQDFLAYRAKKQLEKEKKSLSASPKKCIQFDLF